MRRFATIAMLGAVLTGGGTVASAATIQAILTGVSSAGAGLSNYIYSLQLTPNNSLVNAAGSTLVSGIATESGLAIIDFPGVTAAVVTSLPGDLTSAAAWTPLVTPVSTAFLDNSAYNVAGDGKFHLTGNNEGNAVDSSTITDVLLKYIGSGLASSTSQQLLIHLTITAANTDTGVGYDSLSRNNVGTSPQVDSFPLIATVPVPAAAWTGMGMLSAMGLVAARKRRA